MKINLTKLLDVLARVKREGVPIDTTDGSHYVNRVGDTSPYQAYSFEIEEAAKEECGHEGRSWFHEGQPCPKCG